jgi:hypothetical protein
MPSADGTTEFVELARAFCAWCEGAKSSDAESLRREALSFVARLYVAAFALPAIERFDYPGTPSRCRRTQGTPSSVALVLFPSTTTAVF